MKGGSNGCRTATSYRLPFFGNFRRWLCQDYLYLLLFSTEIFLKRLLTLFFKLWATRPEPHITHICLFSLLHILQKDGQDPLEVFLKVKFRRTKLWRIEVKLTLIVPMRDGPGHGQAENVNEETERKKLKHPKSWQAVGNLASTRHLSVWTQSRFCTQGSIFSQGIPHIRYPAGWIDKQLVNKIYLFWTINSSWGHSLTSPWTFPLASVVAQVGRQFLFRFLAHQFQQFFSSAMHLTNFARQTDQVSNHVFLRF